MFSLYQKIIFKVFLNFFMIFFIFLSIFSLIQGIEGQLSVIKMKRYLGGFSLSALHLSVLYVWTKLRLEGDTFSFELWGNPQKKLSIFLWLFSQLIGLLIILTWGHFTQNDLSKMDQNHCIVLTQTELCWTSNLQMLRKQAMLKNQPNTKSQEIVMMKPKLLTALKKSIASQSAKTSLSLNKHGFHLSIWMIGFLGLNLWILAQISDRYLGVISLFFSIIYMGGIFFLIS
jgi:hypothetical protein